MSRCARFTETESYFFPPFFFLPRVYELEKRIEPASVSKRKGRDIVRSEADSASRRDHVPSLWVLQDLQNFNQLSLPIFLSLSLLATNFETLQTSYLRTFSQKLSIEQRQRQRQRLSFSPSSRKQKFNAPSNRDSFKRKLCRCVSKAVPDRFERAALITPRSQSKRLIKLPLLQLWSRGDRVFLSTKYRGPSSGGKLRLNFLPSATSRYRIRACVF